jgi:hypothetical protein
MDENENPADRIPTYVALLMAEEVPSFIYWYSDDWSPESRQSTIRRSPQLQRVDRYYNRLKGSLS